MSAPEHAAAAQEKSVVPEEAVRVCVIDLGTNSFHAVIVDVHPSGAFRQVDRLKEMVYLGGGSLEGGRLSEEAMARAFSGLERICLLARGWGAHEFVADATSALREAENGGVFIERARQELGLVVRPIAGRREADLIYKGVRHAVDLETPALIVDIGGGSAECIVGDRERAFFAESLKLGAARLTERFVKTDPISEAEGQALRAYCREVLQPVFEACRAQDVRRLVGSSGTMEGLAAACLRRQNSLGGSIFQQHFSASAMRATAHRVARASRAEREATEGIEPHRVEQIAAGAALVEVLLDGLPIEEMQVSPYALREGMVVDFIERNGTRLRQLAPLSGSVRRRSVVELGFRFRWEEAHARHVARFALALFDACRALLPGYGGAERELLEYAALLHDLGYHISHQQHHRHSQYLIGHADLHGFSATEIQLIALVARYHRGTDPSEAHPAFDALGAEQRARVRHLAALLRLAEALDRGHFQNVQTLGASLTEEALVLALETKSDPQLETWAVEQSRPLFEEAFGRAVVVSVRD